MKRMHWNYEEYLDTPVGILRALSVIWEVEAEESQKESKSRK